MKNVIILMLLGFQIIEVNCISTGLTASNSNSLILAQEEVATAGKNNLINENISAVEPGDFCGSCDINYKSVQ